MSVYLWESYVDVNHVREVLGASKVFFGCGAIEKIDFIASELKGKNIDKVIVVSGKSAYKVTGAWEHCLKAFEKYGIKYINYDKISPNPIAADVDDARKIALDFGAKAVIAIGGGSPIDAGKSTAILMEYPDKTCNELYELTFTPTKAAPVVAINLTHGTGTECNRFAVVTIPEKDYKPAIAYDCIYPYYSIDDPNLCLTLSKDQTIFTAIDAVNHVIEAATTTVASPYSIELARRAIELVVAYLPKAIKDPQDKIARYWLMYASLIAGISFDNSLLHFTHALEHPLSAVKQNLSHGLGLAMILPAVIEEIYDARPHVIDYILEPIISDECCSCGCAKAKTVAYDLEQWLFSVGVTSKLEDQGFGESDINELVNLVQTTPGLSGLVMLAPVDGSSDVIRRIYTKSLKPMK